MEKWEIKERTYQLKNMSQDERAKELGMTSEHLSGRSMFIEFDPEDEKQNK